jgi:hypothetical protein
MKVFLRVFYLIVTVFILANVSYANSSVFRQGIAQVNVYTGDKVLVKANVYSEKYSSQLPFKYQFGWGADYSGETPPKYIVSFIEIKWGKESVYIPLSAYSDLTEPKNIELQVDHNNIILIILGADAGCAYQAELVFENAEIKYRKVSLGEFPDRWEKTEYHFTDSP